MTNQAQCTECQWIGEEKATRERNLLDGQIEWRCPECRTYGSIIEANKKNTPSGKKNNIAK